MKASILHTLGWFALISLIGTTAKPATAQPITPAPDGTGTLVTPDGQSYDIQGGTLSRDGSNLFHSFQQFGLNQGQTANFISNPQIQNILGRVVGGDPSIINGLIQITGGNSNLFLMNPAGILFGPNASLNIPADFTATTASGIGFGNGWFNAFGTSDYANLVETPSAFSFNMSQLGTIINEGNLTLTNGSNLNLFANTIINTGTLSTPGGNINITAIPNGNTLRISQPGHILSLEIDTQKPGFFEKSGFLADRLTGGDPLHHATTVEKLEDGTIRLTGSQTPIPLEPGITVVSGNMSVVTGQMTNDQGQMTILGDKIALIGANIDASGASGGGNIHIGLETGFLADNLDSDTKPLISETRFLETFAATHTYIDQNTNISANAISSGNGGQIIIWSDNTTQFHGNISATGVENGGFVEVSGKQNLIFRGNVDLSAPNGNNGSLLLDPENITIVDGSGGADDSQLSDNQILSWDVGTTYTISETALENLNGNAAVELQATNNITVEDLTDNELTFQSGTGAITFTADADNDGSGAFTMMDAGDTIRAEGRNITINAASITLGSIYTSLTSGNGGAVTLNAGNDISTGDICAGCNSNNAANLTINSSNGAINTGKLWAFSFIGNGGAIDLSASGNIQINGDISSRGNSAGANINITSTAGDIIHRGRLESFSSGGNAGAVTFNAPGNIHLGDINSRGSSIGGNINITSTAGDIIHLGKLESFSSWGNGGSVTFDAPGNIHLGDINSSGNSAGANINITSTAGDIIHLGKLESFSSGGNAGSVTFDAPGNIHLGDINSSGSMGGNINITSTGGDIRSGKLESDSSSGNAGSVTFNATGSIITGDISSAGNNQGGTVTINTSGTLITGGINSSGASAGSDINLTSINGGITIRNGTLNSSSTNGSGGQINLSADTGILTGSVNSTAYSQGGNITLTTTNGDIDTSSGTLNANASNGPNGTIVINAPSGSITAGNITGPQNIQIVNGGTDNPNTATPSVSVNSDADMINSNSGLVSLQAHNDITITEPIITNTISHLELKAGRSININADIDTSGSNGDITLQGNHNGADPAYRQFGAGNIIMAPNTHLNAGSGNILVQLGSLGQVGTINLGNINTTGGVSVISPGGNINLTDNQSLINAGTVSFQTYGSGNIGSAAQPIQLNANNLEAIAGSGGAFFQSPNSGVTVGGANSSIIGISASGGPVSLTAIGNIVASEDIWTWVAGGNAGDITIVSSGGGIDTDSSTLSAYSSSGNGGNITVTAPQDINLGLVNSWDQNSTANVNATSGNNINVAGGLNVGRNQSVNLLADNDITISNQANGLFFSFQEYSQGASIYFTADYDQNGAGNFFTNSDSIIWAKTRDVNISGANVTLGTVVTGIPRGQGGDLNIISENTISTANLDTASADGHAGNINLEVTGSNYGSITTGNLAALTYYQGDGGQVSIDANGGNVNTGNIDTFSNVSSALYGGGDIDISGGNITAGNINTGNRGAGGAGYGGNINITAVGDMITGAINAAGNVAGGDITLTSTNGSINTSTGFIESYSGQGTAGTVTVEAERNIATAGVQSYGYNDAGDINMTSNQGTIGAGEIQSYSLQSNAGNVTLNAPNGNIALENIRSEGATIGGNLTINSGGSFTTTGTINSYASASNGVAGNVNITANDSITLGTDASNSALINSEGPQQGGSISITSTTGAIDATTGWLSSFASSGEAGNVTITALGNISLSDIASYGDTNGGSISITSTTGAIDATTGGLSSFANSGEAGNVTITAPGNISLSDISSYGATNGGSISITSSGGTIDTSNGILGAYSISGNGGNITLNANSDVNTGFIRAFATGNNSQSGNVTITSSNGEINTTVGNLSGEALINADADLADIAGTFLSQLANIDVYAPSGSGGNVRLEAPQGITTSHISSYGGINAGSVTATSQSGDINTNVIFSVADGAGDGGNITLAAPNGNIATSHINSYTNGQGAGGAIEITTGGTFNIGAATINSFSENGIGGDVTITANGNIVLGGDANRSALRSQGDQQGGSISITSNNGMISATAGNLDSYSTNGNAGDVTLNAPNGNIATQNIRSEGDTKGGSIEITTGSTYSGGTINSYATTATTGEAGDVSITAAGNINLGGDATNSAIRSEGAQVGGDISITSDNGTISAAGDLNSFSQNGTAGNVSLDAATGIDIANIRSEGAQVGGDISITSDNGTISAAGDLNSFSQNGTAGNVSLDAATGIDIANIRSEGAQVGGNISITSDNGTISAAGDLNSFSQNGTAGNVTLDAAGNVATQNIRSDGDTKGGSISITSNNSLDFTGNTLNSYSENGTAGDVTITANGTIILGGDATNSAIRSQGDTKGGSISITSNNGDINTTAGNLDSYSTNGTAGNVTLQSSGDIATASIRSDGQQQGGNISITSNGGAIDTTRGNLSSYSDGGNAGNVILNAGGGNVTTGNIDSKSPQLGGKITITSAGDLNTSLGDLLSYSTAGIAGDITLKAAGCVTTGDIRTDGATQAGSLSITSCNCFIDTSLGTLTTYSPNGTAGDVSLDAVGSVTTGDITSYGNLASGNVNIQTDSGTIRTNHIETISPNGIAGNVTLNTFSHKGDILTANITSQGGQQAGDISVKAPDGSVTTGNIASISESGDSGDIDVEAGEDVQTGDITSSGGDNSGDVDVSSNNGSVTTGNITTEAQNGDSGNVTVGAAKDVQTGDITSSGGNNSGDVDVNSDNGSVTTGNITTEAQNGDSGNVTVGAAKDVQTGDITSSGGNNSGNIEVNSSGGSVTTGNVTSSAVNGNSGNIALSGFGDVTAGDIRSVAGGNSGDIEVNSVAGNITAGDIESRAAGGMAGNITLDAYQNINTGRVTSTGALGSGDINLNTVAGTISTGGIYTDTGRININAPQSSIPIQQPVASGLSLANTVIPVEALPDNVSSTITVDPTLRNNPSAVVGGNNNPGNNISLSATANIPAANGGNLVILAETSPVLSLTPQATPAAQLNNTVQSNASQLNSSLISHANISSSGDDGNSIRSSSQLDTQKVRANLAVVSSGASLVNADSVVASLEQSRSDEYAEYFGSNFGQTLNTTASMREAMSKIAEETGYKSAIIYVMAQPDQLELILFLDSGDLIRKTVPEAPREKLLEVVSQFRSQLTVTRLGQRTDGYRKPAQQLYQWLIAPIEAELQAAGINTLLFSMDSGLRSLPMAALYDGQQFLVEKYSMSQIPSMNLIDPRYRHLKDTRVLAMGASTFQDLAPLPAVPVELSAVTEDLWQGEGFLNENFTRRNLVRQRQHNPYPIIHLATHGEFKPGTPENSYIQLWGDEKLRLNELRELGWHNPAVELLVLSACRTALGNEQAEMGFAGLAVQAGVKTALASLWSVSDEGTLALMTEFYRHLENAKIKSEALRQAQIAMIRGELEVSAGELRSSGGTRGALALPPELSEVENSNLSHPYYWSAFMMIGSPW